MGFTRLAFKRDWNNAEDFTTVLNDETEVRADMQALHDEAKDGLNALMDELEAPAAASSLGAKDHTGGEGSVQDALDGLADELKKVSEVKIDDLRAQNIILDKKGESSLADQYGLTSLVPTVYEALTRLGPLGGIVDALVDLAPSRKYGWYWWMRRTSAESLPIELSAEKAVSGSSESATTYIIYDGGSSAADRTVQYADSVVVDENGVIQLVDPQEATLSYSDCQGDTARALLAGKYVYNAAGTLIMYIPESATPGYAKSTSDWYHGWLTPVCLVTCGAAEREWEYLYSEDREAYPDSGVQGEYEYQYLGRPIENTVSGARVASGSYVGTGLYGESFPNVLTFEFVPKAVFIVPEATGDDFQGIVLMQGATMFGGFGQFHGTSGTVFSGTVYISWEGNRVSWYSSQGQQNTLGKTYYWIAIG